MLTTPTIVDRDAQLYAAVHRTVSLTDLGSIVGPAFDVVADFVRQHSGEDSGPSFIKYTVVDMEGLMQLEFGIPLDTAVEGSGEVFVGELPAGRYATVTHTGSYDDLYDVTGMLVGWAKENGVEWDSAPEGAGERFVSRVEWYLNDPAATPVEQLETRLDFKVRASSGV